VLYMANHHAKMNFNFPSKESLHNFMIHISPALL
jgi:hypothetical protein